MGRGAVMQIPDDDWLDHQQAADELGLPRWRVRLLVANGRVYRARNSSGEFGVARDSVQAELRWRNHASVPDRVRRLVADTFTWGP